MAAACLHRAGDLLCQPHGLLAPALGLAWPAAAASNRVRLAAAAAATSRGPLPADVQLADAVFHCPADGAALRPSRRRSTPGGWLDERPLVAALAAAASDPEGSDDCLLGWAGVRTNHVGDERSGVSLARWTKLLDVCRAADLSLPAGPQLLRLACLRAAEAGAGSPTATRYHLLRFYAALDERLPVLTEAARWVSRPQSS